MGESAAEAVAEIERIRERIDRDVNELQAKLPSRKRLVRIAAALVLAIVVIGRLMRGKLGFLVPAAAGAGAGFALGRRLAA